MRAITLLAYAGALALLATARTLEPLVAAAGALAGGALLLLAWRRRSVEGIAAGLLVAVVSAATGIAGGRIAAMPTQWPDIEARQAERGATDLDRAVQRAVAEAEEAAERGVRSWAALDPGDATAGAPEPARFQALDEARGDRANALFALGATGELVAWSGLHQGPLPEALRAAGGDFAFAEGPLFDYLYVVRPGARGVRVIAAILLETDPALTDRSPASLASGVRERTGARPRFGAGPGAPGVAWRFGPEGQEVVHASLDVVTPTEWRAEAIGVARGRAVAFAVLALVLVLASWLGAGAPGSWARLLIPAAAAGVALGVAPQPGGGAASLFHPAMFLLPLADGVTLWGVFVVALPSAALAAVHGGLPARSGAAALAAGAIAAALALGAWVAGASASDDLLRAGPALWWGLQVAWASILGVATAVLLPRPGSPPPADGRTRAVWWIAAGLALGVLLGAALVLAREPWQGAEPWFALAWAAPAYLVARGTPRLRFGGLRRWLAAGALAATALLPQLWLASADARLRGAEADVERLAAPTDPFMDFLLARLGAEARERYGRGEGGAELLYRAWVGSGLAAEGYPVRLALWGPDGEVAERLDITGSGDDPDTGSGMIADIVRVSREADLPIRRHDPSPEVRQAQAVPLGGGWVASALVLPRRSLAPEGLAAAALGTRDARPATATLTLTASTTAGARAEGLRWAASVAGVRGEGEIRLGDVVYHAHVEVDQAPAPIRVARGVLLVVVDLLALALIWGFAHILAGSPRPPPAPWIPAPGSFRSRVTLALFFFFLVPTLAFGAVAYRTVAGAAEREAEATVSRASAQAVDVFAAAGGNLQTVAGLVGLDVLFYQGGELITSSRPELVGLGVHDAWLAPDAHIALREGEALALDRGRSLLGRRAVTGFRRLAPAGVVGIPALPGGAAAARRAELTDILLFAILLGAVLSLALSLAAGRALARPIGQLSRAASAVGEGRSRVDLPFDRRDEFGELFRTFNRMTRGLRRARARELRSARVLAWGEMARQVAHEIKNPLTPIRLSVQHVRRAFRDGRHDFGDILEGNVEQVLHEIDRLSDIARAFARYGAPAEPQPALESVDVEAVARDVQALYASGDRGMRVRVESEPDLPPVAARDGELREVLINLLENARDALPEGGVAEVTLRREGAEVALRVSDGGEGIPADVLSSVFEPHFSTRSSGTGLGLAIVKRLVEDWGGRIVVESEPGRGTAFKIWLKEAEAGGAE